MIDLEIEGLPSDQDELDAESRAVRDEVLEKFQDRLQDKQRERFKVDALVDHVRSQGAIEVSDIVRAISRMMQAARYQFPKHAPIDAAYLLIQDGGR